MGNGDANAKSALGFLTVLDHPQHGLFGGYLVLNRSGQPMEFHCTAPIKPNRAQEILYGSTLESFLYGEQIGQTLLRKASVEPLFVCTDRAAVLAVREHVSLPVGLVLAAEDGRENEEGEFWRIDAAHYGGSPGRGPSCRGPGMIAFRLGQNRFAVAEDYQADRRLIVEGFGCVAESFDLAEPFMRIREAIEEAQQAVRAT